MYFAALTLTEFLPILSVMAGMLVAFYAMLKYLLDRYTKSLDAASIERRALVTSGTADRENERTERLALMQAIDKMAKSSQDVAEATKQAAQEAKERNGHLGEQNVQITNLITQSHKEMLTHFKQIKEQHVDTQIVDKEIIKSR